MATGEEVVCGTLHIRDATSGPHQGQVYSIECGGYACGDQVRLGVQQSAGDNERMITMKEITAFYSVGVSRLLVTEQLLLIISWQLLFSGVLKMCQVMETRQFCFNVITYKRIRKWMQQVQLI